MLRVAVVLLLVVATCAQQCVPFKATPTAGMCKDYIMNGARCTSTSTPTSDQISAEIVKKSNDLDQNSCMQSYTYRYECARYGGKASPDLCKTGGNYCKFETFSSCKTDAHCAEKGVRPFICCSAIKYMIDISCTGVNRSAVDTMISQAKKETAGALAMVCRDTDCIEWNSASSLCTTPIALFIVALLAITTSFFGQR